MASNGRMLSGSLLVGTEEAPSSIGIVSGETPVDGDGIVQVTLGAEHVEASFSAGISLRMLESVAKKIADACHETAIRLSHLRALHRLGKLDPRAIVEPAPARPEPRVPTEAGSGELLLGLPEPAGEPQLSWSLSRAVLSYEEAAGAPVRIELVDMIATRTRRGQATGPSHVQRTTADAWMSQTTGRNHEDTDFEHFVFVFPRVQLEVIAREFKVT